MKDKDQKNVDAEVENLAGETAADAAQEENANDNSEVKVKSKKSDEPPESFCKVVFQARTSNSQPLDVTISLNGTTLVVQREKPVVVPKSFLEVADQAVITGMRWEVNGEESSLVPTKIRKFPYSVIDPNATELEYLEMRNRGTTETRNRLKSKEIS